MAVLLPAYLLFDRAGDAGGRHRQHGDDAGLGARDARGRRLGISLRGGAPARCAALLMAATGIGFAGLSSFWPLLVVALVGTLNPSSGDVSVFLPLEHARLASAAQGHARTALFARYSLIGALCAALGALAAAAPDWLVRAHGTRATRCTARDVRGLRRHRTDRLLALSEPATQAGAGSTDSMPVAPAPLGPSRRVVMRLAALFSMDAFAGGLTVNALMSLWLLERFGFSLTQAGVFFFWTGLLSAASQLAAPAVAQRIGLLNTMVFTHLPANVCLVLAAVAPSLPVALALLMIRSSLSSMDVPTRTAYVMAVVDARRTQCGRELHRRAAKPGRGHQPDAQRRAVRSGMDLAAAGRMRTSEDHLRPRALARDAA
ncbi:hypothetical protein DdX_21132 [Ditylenchus destructor]|uniref:MFS transporter n=1 Tax=Ditylenchus destructor TaxID=166010 RepID=A0AAD4MK68_9BILA|nr:hypothetical protein DdX_21132 [Ditylenchus destructor]